MSKWLAICLISTVCGEGNYSASHLATPLSFLLISLTHTNIIHSSVQVSFYSSFDSISKRLHPGQLPTWRARRDECSSAIGNAIQYRTKKSSHPSQNARDSVAARVAKLSQNKKGRRNEADEHLQKELECESILPIGTTQDLLELDDEFRRLMMKEHNFCCRPNIYL
jgi:DNA-binding transcriptional regulator of glucitol operon